MITFSFLFFITSIYMPLLSHPLSMSIILITSTLMISILTSTLIKQFWFSYILILIFIGGMLILFIYMVSLIPNKKFKFNYNMLWPFFTLPVLLTISPLNFSEMNLKINQIFHIYLNTIKIFNSTSSLLTILTISFLFLIMIMVTKITKSIKGPIRSNF
uniref:NADH dehydrogenase subunit 6 n=1 Tax=Lepinotus reticulatus TaxID=209981 RepID=A0A3S8IEB6_9NEOP|nr:NADH dehydrogenase subunit 6 [Lepinotus reticulatus]